MTNQLVKKACEITFEHPEFRTDFIQLTKNELSPDYENPLSNEQITKLLETASLFALDPEKKYQKLAFKISVYLLNQYQKQVEELPVAVEIIMSRLGNIPTIYSMIMNKHGKDYFGFFDNGETTDFNTVSTYLQFPEILVKQITNKQKITEDISLTFTDFQATIYSLLMSKKNVTFSAPTSTGKSYVLHSYIAEQVLKSEKFCAVYLVPTKALIAEVKEKIEKTIIQFGIKHNEFAVFMSANYINSDEIEGFSKKIFVLTQERLQETMANNPLTAVDLLVVDEAQKISDESRGVIIEDSVKELIRANPEVQMVVISPYAKNPEVFQTIFEITGDIKSEITVDSPVTKNVFYINFGKKCVTISLDSWDLDLEESEKILKEIKVERVKDLPESKTKRKAWVVNNLLPEKEPTIVYCDKPYDCRQVARRIAEGAKQIEQSQNLKDAIQFFSENVHQDYYLVDALKNRIGYHYGKMP